MTTSVGQAEATTLRLDVVEAVASFFRDDNMTCAPEAAKVAAIARPMPFDAPVTSATFPSSRTSIPGTYWALMGYGIADAISRVSAAWRGIPYDV